MYLQSCCFATLNLLLVDVTVFAEVAYYLTCSDTLIMTFMSNGRDDHVIIFSRSLFC